MKLIGARVYFVSLFMVIGLMVMAQGAELRLHWPSLEVSARPYLTQYYGHQLQFLDSMIAEPQAGYFRYERSTPMPPGIYFIQAEGQAPIELIMDTDQQMMISVSPEDGVVHFKACPDNQNYQALLAQLSITSDSLKLGILNGFCSSNPHHLVCRMRRMQQEPLLPDQVPTGESLSSGQPWELAYLKQHYWDQINFQDPILLRTPLWTERLKRYVEGLLVPAPSPSILQHDVQTFLDTLSIYPELFRYSFNEMLSFFETAPYMEAESIWVFMIEAYIETGRCPWYSSAVKANLSQRVAEARPWMIGERPPEIWYPDTGNTRRFEDMHSILGSSSGYTLIFFWDPECSHCKQELAVLRSLYAQHKQLGFELISVGMHSDLDKVKRVVRESQFPWRSLYGGGGPAARQRSDLWPIHSMPTIFLLDADKRIVLKNVTIHSIETYLNNTVPKNP